MFCGQCGTSLPEGARFCGKCGAPTSGAGSAESSRPESLRLATFADRTRDVVAADDRRIERGLPSEVVVEVDTEDQEHR